MIHEIFPVGPLQCNCSVIGDETTHESIVIDPGADIARVLDTVQRHGLKVTQILITHGHIDHVQDVAKIKHRFDCPIGCHAETAPMISDREFFRRFGFELEIEPIQPDFLISETPERDFLALKMQVLEVPGHCPGSLCFFSRENELLIGGDVLFAGGVGRWDLPGGDGELLFAGIKQKLFPLGDNVTVLPGHGPPTKIGTERRTNPFLQ